LCEISEGYAALVMSGIEDYLLQEGYFYFVVSHRHRDDLVARNIPVFLQDTAVEGLIAVDTACQEAMPIPVVAVFRTCGCAGRTNIVLNPRPGRAGAGSRALAKRGIENAFIKGQASARNGNSWDSVRRTAGEQCGCRK